MNRKQCLNRLQGLILAMTAFTYALGLNACTSSAEKSARELARRIVPQYNIRFEKNRDTTDSYTFHTRGKQLVISGSGPLAMSAGLGRYLQEYCHADVSWYAADPVVVPDTQPAVPVPVHGRARVAKRFFLNYCTFGYSMPWWQWEDWERLIDWMALHGVNMPLATTGQEASWMEVWRQHGLSDNEIRAWFTGPAHLPWHRMCNIDGVDGPLPQGWIDGQETLQKRIVARERALGMTPVLPAFAGHVPAQLKRQYPAAHITDISGWGGFPPENLPHFLSPEDSLYAVIQRQFLQAQEKRYGTDHVYGFDLFNEVDPPSWDPETLAGIARNAYASVAAADPDALWLQMGWLFHYDRKHWTAENIKAFLQAVPQGKMVLLDYYTEHTPVWKETDAFYGQPYLFCYLGNFGGNTRLAGPFRRESGRITEALDSGGAAGIGCTLEGFGINRWFYEYTLSRAWDTGVSDDAWLAGLDRRHHSPEGFWKDMADSIYLRGSFSEGALLCGRPCLEGHSSWRVICQTPYAPETLERLWRQLQAHPFPHPAWKQDVVMLGCQVLGNRFAQLRDRFTAAYRAGDPAEAQRLAEQMQVLLRQLDRLAWEDPAFRLENWLEQAQAWASSPEEKAYYRHNAWQIVTTWGGTPNLNDYASRMWSGLIRDYYAARWKLFTDTVLSCMEKGEAFDQQAFDQRCEAWEQDFVARAPQLSPQADTLTLLSYNVGVFSKYGDSLEDVARLIGQSGASLVALNELDSCNRRHGVFQLERLASRLGCNAHFASAFPFAGGAYGNGVLSVLPILRRETVQLPQLDGYEPRSVAVVETPQCVFASVHLDFAKSSPQQAALINAWFRERFTGCSKPVFLCGDMNAQPGSETYSVLQEAWEPLSGNAPTYSTEEPHRCIDHIFSFKAAAPVRVISQEVLTEGTERFSDHFPVKVSVSCHRIQ